MTDVTIPFDWQPRAGDLMLLRIQRQYMLASPPSGWRLMGRWRMRREQLWSRVAMPGEATSLTVRRLSGKATVSVLRDGKLLRIGTT